MVFFLTNYSHVKWLRSKNDLLLNFEQNKLSPWPSMCADFSISMHIILKVEEGEMANIVHIKVCRYILK